MSSAAEIRHIGIAGAGRVGQALGRLLQEAGAPVRSVASRTPSQAASAAAFIGPGVQPLSYSELALRASHVLVCVPDSAIERVAQAMAGFHGVALHTCGAKGPEALESLRARGAAVGVMHPLQTVADAASGVSSLRGVAFAVSGDAAAVRWAGEIAKAAGGRTMHIADGSRPLYHAAAVMASNYIVALLEAARELLVAAGIEPGEALAALGPLARQSLENTLRAGPAAALTGPIERGDAGTIAAHLRALESVPESTRTLYRAAGMETLDIARRRGLSAGVASAIEQLLRDN